MDWLSVQADGGEELDAHMVQIISNVKAENLFYRDNSS